MHSMAQSIDIFWLNQEEFKLRPQELGKVPWGQWNWQRRNQNITRHDRREWGILPFNGLGSFKLWRFTWGLERAQVTPGPRWGWGSREMARAAPRLARQLRPGRGAPKERKMPAAETHTRETLFSLCGHLRKLETPKKRCPWRMPPRVSKKS